MEKVAESLNKKELLDKLISENPQIDADKIEEALDTFFNEMSTALVCGDRIELRGFGSMVVRKRESGTARNPKNGTTVQVADRGSLYFRASKDLLKDMNDSAGNDN